MNENTLEIKWVDAGAGNTPASSVDSGNEPAKPVSDSVSSGSGPAYIREIDAVINKVNEGLLSFDSGIETVNALFEKYRSDISRAESLKIYQSKGETPAAEGDIRPNSGLEDFFNVNAKTVEAQHAEQTAKNVETFFDEIKKKVSQAATTAAATGNQTSTPTAEPVSEESEQLKNLSRMAKASLYAASVGGLGGQSASGFAQGAVGIASTGALGEGAAALAGGPYGLIAIAAAKAADVAVDKVADTYRTAQKGMQLGADVATDVIGGNPMGAVVKASNAAADSLERIPVVGKIFAEQVRTNTVALTAFAQVVDAVTGRAKELQGYNGDIAQASANQQVAKIEGDIREAERLGELYASTLDSQTSLQNDFREIMLPLKEVVVTVLADLLRGLAMEVKAIKPFLQAGADGVLIAVQSLETMIQLMTSLPGVGNMLKSITQNIEADRQREEQRRIEEINGKAQTATSMLFGLAQMGTNLPPSGVRLGQEERQLNIPLIGKN